ncbi:TOMM precursor leader peptide-binding protein [Microlunatus sp. Gsoil 973]|uniref:TOMM precursor leader peptide-binding protein n=1 Tax=Microlunatus sp. Gsoil 973 TaxID=2672569 RepID=UPI0018A83AE4|nr:TOMM precursor leader peptide-binding protein [Microlunatus sp. Gsoil 973]
MITQNGYLIATAGADETWVVDDVAGRVVAELAACWSDRPPTFDQLSRAAALAVEQLRPVGVFGPPNTLPATPQIAIRFCGDPVPVFTETLTALNHDQGWPEPLTDDIGTADLEVVVRSSGTLVEAAELGGPLLHENRIHLLCDLAAASTIAVGPLVVPGHTACLGCLTGRIANRWGDPPTPDRPGATGRTGATTAAGIVARQLQLAVEESRFPLIDATVAVDLDTLQANHSPCLTLPRCPYCAELRNMSSDGRVVLPWVD